MLHSGAPIGEAKRSASARCFARRSGLAVLARGLDADTLFMERKRGELALLALMSIARC